MIMKNWKTTSLGIVSIIVAAGSVVDTYVAHGTPNWTIFATQVASGIGLILTREQSQHEKDKETSTNNNETK